MPVNRGGGKKQNAPKVVSKDLSEKAFMVIKGRASWRPYDKDSILADATTSHNGVVKTTAGNR
jgi:hypothetical protein